MPELPEVETVRTSLLPHILNKRIANVKVWRKDVLLSEPSLLEGRIITGADRRGKYLILLFDDDSRLMLHLRMTGRLTYNEICPAPEKHTHVQLLLEPAGCLSWTDVRRFGRLQQFAPGEKLAGTAFGGLEQLGPEPVASEITIEYLEAVCKRHAKASIKALLLNQQVIAGLGNIYADEILFQAGIHPARAACSLNHIELASLAEAIPDVIARAINQRGTTFRDYVDGEMRTGGFQRSLCVYGRKGELCTVCATKIECMRLAGRTTCFCPGCQR